MNIDQRLHHDSEKVKQAVSRLKHTEEPDVFHRKKPMERLRKAGAKVLTAALITIAASGMLPNNVKAQAQHTVDQYNKGKLGESELIAHASDIYKQVEKTVVEHIQNGEYGKAKGELTVFIKVTKDSDRELYLQLLDLEFSVDHHISSDLAKKGEGIYVYGDKVFYVGEKNHYGPKVCEWLGTKNIQVNRAPHQSSFIMTDQNGKEVQVVLITIITHDGKNVTNTGVFNTNSGKVHIMK